jgi:uncharacterized protein (DUF488 family)
MHTKLTEPRHEADDPGSAGRTQLLSVGHGTMTSEALAELFTGAGVELVVDVRSVPGSRRHPQFGRSEFEVWLPAAGVGYRWERDLGGFRRPEPSSRNVALRHPSFRGYADHMVTGRFRHALERMLDDAAHQVVTIMCAETLWWRCHRRLIADAATLCCDAEVRHLGHDGRLSPHRLTAGVRVDSGGGLVYDAGQPPLDAGGLGEFA